MKRTFKTSALKSLIAAGTVATAALSPLAAAPAAADGWHKGNSARHYDRRGNNCVYSHGKRICGPRGGWHNPRPVHRDNGDAAAAAILGIAGIAIIAGALSEANNPAPRDHYVAPDAYPPAPSRGPNVITYESSLEPWTVGWYEWCDERYRSFNPKTGTYRGYDGLDHFCVPK